MNDGPLPTAPAPQHSVSVKPTQQGHHRSKLTALGDDTCGKLSGMLMTNEVWSQSSRTSCQENLLWPLTNAFSFRSFHGIWVLDHLLSCMLCMKREIKWNGTHIITVKGDLLDTITVCLGEEIHLNEGMLVKTSLWWMKVFPTLQ